MQTQKISLANIKGKLSRAEMKRIMAGIGGGSTCNCNSASDCTAYNEKCMNSCGGQKGDTYQGKCGCP